MRRTVTVVVLAAAGIGMASGMFSKLFGGGAWSLDHVPPPWGTRTSIHDHVSSHLEQDGTGLSEGGETLPDESSEAWSGGLRWAPGALDGVMGHHAGGEEEGEAADEVIAALDLALQDATPRNVGALYGVLKKHSALSYADTLLEAFRGTSGDRLDRMHALATWLATRAPDREPVKAGIVLLGLGPRSGDEEVLLTLGSHEEFTVFSAVALANVLPEPDQTLWKLAKRVHGWGRIHTVERLAKTTDPRIKAWLLREGFKNAVMYEYLAFTCAVTGGLESELEKPEIDEALFTSAGEILSTLIVGQGGPAEGIDDYESGAAVMEAFLRHSMTKAASVEHFLAINTIKDFLSRDEGWDQRRGTWTPELRARLTQQATLLWSRPDWKEKALVGLQSKDRIEFWSATAAAKALGLDPWPAYFERVASGEDYWFQLLETTDEVRFTRALELAQERIPLAEIASGPAEELGLGAEFVPHSHLDSVLQALPRFAPRGWPFIKAGLRSPVVRNRHMALRALASWPRSEWPAEAELEVRRGASHEPREEVRARFEDLIAGRPLQQ